MASRKPGGVPSSRVRTVPRDVDCLRCLPRRRSREERVSDMIDSTAAIASTARARRAASPRMTIVFLALMFFVFGFVTWLNGPLITFVKLAFALSDVEGFLVPSVFYMSYFFLALPAAAILRRTGMKRGMARSDEHTSELQSLMRISYAVFCLKKKNTTT